VENVNAYSLLDVRASYRLLPVPGLRIDVTAKITSFVRPLPPCAPPSTILLSSSTTLKYTMEKIEILFYFKTFDY